MAVPSPVYMETVKDAALDLIRLAVEFADADSPFKGLNVPLHRFGSQDFGRWPVLEAHVGDDEGRGSSKLAPDLGVTADLVFDGLVAAGRDEADDLDLQASLLVQAICDLLLTDQSFLARFAWLVGLRRQREDASVSIRNAGEVDAVVFRITMTLAFNEGYTPIVPPPAATTINITSDVAPNPTEDDPAARWFVVEQFDTPPEER